MNIAKGHFVAQTHETYSDFGACSAIPLGKQFRQSAPFRLENPLIHGFDVAHDRPEIHVSVSEYILLQINARSNFNQFHSVACQLKDRTLGHVEYGLIVRRCVFTTERDLLDLLKELAAPPFLNDAQPPVGRVNLKAASG